MLAAFGVAFHRGGDHVFLHDGGAVGIGLAEELFGEFGHFAFAALISPAFFDIYPRGRELAFFHALEEFERGGGVGGEDGHEVTFEAGTGFGQEFVNERRGAGGAEFFQQGHGGRSELQRLRGGEQVFHHRLDSGPFPRRQQRQHGEALIERCLGIGDDGVDLRLKRGDLLGGVFVAFGQFGETLEQCGFPPEEFAGLLLEKGEQCVDVAGIAISERTGGKGAEGVALGGGEGGEEAVAELAEDAAHVLR